MEQAFISQIRATHIERARLFKIISTELSSSAPWIVATSGSLPPQFSKRPTESLSSSAVCSRADSSTDSPAPQTTKHPLPSLRPPVLSPAASTAEALTDLTVHRTFVNGGIARMKSLGNLGPQFSASRKLKLAEITRKFPTGLGASSETPKRDKMLEIERKIKKRNFQITQRARALREKDFARHYEQVEKSKAISDLRRVVESFVRAKKDRTLVIDFKDRTLRRAGVALVPLSFLPQMAQVAQQKRRDPFGLLLSESAADKDKKERHNSDQWRGASSSETSTPRTESWDPQEAELRDFIAREIEVYELKKQRQSHKTHNEMS